MMMWHICEYIMPGEKNDIRKNPGDETQFLVCYHTEDKNVVNPKLKVTKALLVDGRFFIDDNVDLQNTTITHWMEIDLP